MKKILLIIPFIIVTIIGCAQTPYSPFFQTLGNKKNIVEAQGALTARDGIIFPRHADTTYSNTLSIKFENGAVVFSIAENKLKRRNVPLWKWEDLVKSELNFNDFVVPIGSSVNGLVTDPDFMYKNGSLFVGSGGPYSATGLVLNKHNFLLGTENQLLIYSGIASNNLPATNGRIIIGGGTQNTYLSLGPSLNVLSNRLEGNVSLDWIPQETDSFNIGTPTKKWKNGYFGNIYSNGTLINPAVFSGYIPLTQKATINGVATLDGGGKIPLNQLPAITLNKPTYVQTLAQMLASPATVGDIYVVADSSRTYALQTLPTNNFANWIELLSPIPTNTDLLTEGVSNLYFTNLRARNAISSGPGINYNPITGVISKNKPDWDAAPGTTDEILNKPYVPLQFSPIQGQNISITGTYPMLTFNTKNIYTITQSDSLANIIRTEINNFDPNLPQYRVPFGSSVNKMTSGVGLTYNPTLRSLNVGADGNFGTTSQIQLNSQNLIIYSSGNGTTMSVGATYPADPSKVFTLQNGARKWFRMFNTNDGALRAKFELWSDLYPAQDSGIYLGTTSRRFKGFYTDAFYMPVGASAGKVLTTDGFGNGTWQTPTGTVGSGVEIDPSVPSYVKSITTQNITDWNTSYGYGPHTGLYKPISYVPTYAEITGKPTIPAAQVNSDWNSVSGLSQILNKPVLLTTAQIAAQIHDSLLNYNPGSSTVGDILFYTKGALKFIHNLGTNADTLIVDTASALKDGILLKEAYANFSAKQNPINLTTIGTSGAATWNGTTLNIPSYAGGSSGSSPWVLSGLKGIKYDGDTAILTTNIPYGIDNEQDNFGGLIVKDSKLPNGTIKIGSASPAYENYTLPAIWFGQATATNTNYGIAGDAGNTVLNTITGKGVQIRINNSIKLSVTSTGVDITGDLKTTGLSLSKFKELASDPTTGDIPAGFTGVFRNTTTGFTYLWANVAGTLIKVQLN